MAREVTRESTDRASGSANSGGFRDHRRYSRSCLGRGRGVRGPQAVRRGDLPRGRNGLVEDVGRAQQGERRPPPSERRQGVQHVRRAAPLNHQDGPSLGRGSLERQRSEPFRDLLKRRPGTGFGIDFVGTTRRGTDIGEIQHRSLRVRAPNRSTENPRLADLGASTPSLEARTRAEQWEERRKSERRSLGQPRQAFLYTTAPYAVIRLTFSPSNSKISQY